MCSYVLDLCVLVNSIEGGLEIQKNHVLIHLFGFFPWWRKVPFLTCIHNKTVYIKNGMGEWLNLMRQKNELIKIQVHLKMRKLSVEMCS